VTRPTKCKLNWLAQHLNDADVVRNSQAFSSDFFKPAKQNIRFDNLFEQRIDGKLLALCVGSASSHYLLVVSEFPTDVNAR